MDNRKNTIEDAFNYNKGKPVKKNGSPARPSSAELRMTGPW